MSDNPCINCLTFPLCKNRFISHGKSEELYFSLTELDYLTKICPYFDFYLDDLMYNKKYRLKQSILEIFSIKNTTKCRFVI